MRLDRLIGIKCSEPQLRYLLNYKLQNQPIVIDSKYTGGDFIIFKGVDNYLHIINYSDLIIPKTFFKKEGINPDYSELRIISFIEFLNIDLSFIILELRERLTTLTNLEYRENDRQKQIKLKRKKRLVENKISFYLGQGVIKLYKNESIDSWLSNHIVKA